MKTAIKNIIPYFLTSIFVIAIWNLNTWIDNYAWFPKGNDLLILENALSSIFYYKAIFWLVVANLIVFSIRQLRKKNFIATIISTISAILIYFIVGQLVDKKCAFHYYSVFHSQSVTEQYLKEPIVSAGYHIGPILTENIGDKKMKYRRYAIVGIEKIQYKPATLTLAKILFDKSELDIFRADAYQTLTTFQTEETRRILDDFKIQATGSIDIKVIELGEYFIKNK